MICPNCAHNVRDGAKFCDECGIVLPASTASTPATSSPRQSSASIPYFGNTPPPAQPAPQPSYSDGGMSGGSMLPPAMDPAGGDGRRKFAIIAGVAVLALCCCCSFFAVAAYFILNQPGM